MSRQPVDPNVPIGQQVPRGIYFVFAATGVAQLAADPATTFHGSVARFCMTPNQTCTASNNNVHAAWNMQDTIMMAMRPDKPEHEAYNLIHWGPNNAEHGTLVGPLLKDRQDKLATLVHVNGPLGRYHPHMIMYVEGRNN